MLLALSGGQIERMLCPAVLVRRPRPAAAGATQITPHPEAFFARPYDAVREVAGHQAVRDRGARVLEAGSDLLVTSVGAFAEPASLTA